MQTLNYTNDYAVMKFIIKEINRFSDDEKLVFKDFVLSALDKREHSPNNLKDLRKIAVDGGYGDEFDKKLEENKNLTLSR